MNRSGFSFVFNTHAKALDDSGTRLVVVGGDFGLERGSKRALEGPIFRSVKGLGRLEHGIVDAKMIGGGCFCVPDTYA